MLFVKAERKQAKLKLGMAGPSGSGKTKSALRLATGFGGKIAVIDTENKSASLYAPEFDFDVVDIEAPYTIPKYIHAIEGAIAEGYEFLIIDSVSHAWAAEGGVLEQKSAIDARGGNQFANWKKPKEAQAKLKAAILHSDIHIILNFRSKQTYETVEIDGKRKVHKMGLEPIQEPGFEYELSTLFNIGMDHKAEASKDRTGMFVDQVFQITEETGKALRDWLGKGKVTAAPEPAPKPPAKKEEEVVKPVVVKALSKRQKDLAQYCEESKGVWSKQQVKDCILKCGKESADELTSEEFDWLANIVLFHKPTNYPKLGPIPPSVGETK